MSVGQRKKSEDSDFFSVLRSWQTETTSFSFHLPSLHFIFLYHHTYMSLSTLLILAVYRTRVTYKPSLYDLQSSSYLLEHFAFHAFCHSPPLCKFVDKTLITNTRVHFVIFQHWKEESVYKYLEVVMDIIGSFLCFMTGVVARHEPPIAHWLEHPSWVRGSSWVRLLPSGTQFFSLSNLTLWQTETYNIFLISKFTELKIYHISLLLLLLIV